MRELLLQAHLQLEKAASYWKKMPSVALTVRLQPLSGAIVVDDFVEKLRVISSSENSKALTNDPQIPSAYALWTSLHDRIVHLFSTWVPEYFKATDESYISRKDAFYSIIAKQCCFCFPSHSAVSVQWDLSCSYAAVSGSGITLAFAPDYLRTGLHKAVATIDGKSSGRDKHSQRKTFVK